MGFFLLKTFKYGMHKLNPYFCSCFFTNTFGAERVHFHPSNILTLFKRLNQNVNFNSCEFVLPLVVRITQYNSLQLLCTERGNIVQLAVISYKHVRSWNTDNHTSASTIFTFPHFTQLHPLHQPSSVIFC